MPDAGSAGYGYDCSFHWHRKCSNRMNASQTRVRWSLSVVWTLNVSNNFLLNEMKRWLKAEALINDAFGL
jgi:hypothetical protein